MGSVELVIGEAQEKLKDYLKCPGNILYSASDTLRCPNGLYVLGINPTIGRTEQKSKITLEMRLKELPKKTDNDYEAEWGATKPGAAKLQMGIKCVIKCLGFELEKTCASNLIFFQSKADGIRPDWADICWPVHKKILQVIQPRIILACGNANGSPWKSPYTYIKNLKDLKAREGWPGKSGHGHYQLKKCMLDIDGQEVLLIGLPHLSWYDPNKCELKTFLECAKRLI